MEVEGKHKRPKVQDGTLYKLVFLDMGSRTLVVYKFSKSHHRGHNDGETS